MIYIFLLWTWWWTDHEPWRASSQSYD